MGGVALEPLRGRRAQFLRDLPEPALDPEPFVLEKYRNASKDHGIAAAGIGERGERTAHGDIRHKLLPDGYPLRGNLGQPWQQRAAFAREGRDLAEGEHRFMS
jgi:hypothetical protein